MTRCGAVAEEQRRRCPVVVTVVLLALVVPGRALLGVETLLRLARVSSIYSSTRSGGAFVIIVAGVRKLILRHQLQRVHIVDS